MHTVLTLDIVKLSVIILNTELLCGFNMNKTILHYASCLFRTTLTLNNAVVLKLSHLQHF